jgi:hypothetical protein
MWILPLVGYLGVIVGFAFLTLAIGKVHPQAPNHLAHEITKPELNLTLLPLQHRAYTTSPSLSRNTPSSPAAS